jgi:O-acetylserine/cysteine efflux transporter
VSVEAADAVPAVRRDDFGARELGAICLIVLLWGLNNVATKVMVEHLPPITAVVARFAVTLIALCAFLRPLRDRVWSFLAIAALVGPLHFFLIFIGFQWSRDLTPVAIAAQLWIPFSVILAALFLGERPTIARVCGVVLGFLGIAVMGMRPENTTSFSALFVVGLGSLVYAASTILARRRGAIDPFQMQAVTALLVLLSLGPVAHVTEPDGWGRLLHAPWWLLLTIVASGIGSGVIANATMTWLVQRAEVQRITPFMLMTPVVSAAGGVLLLGDRLVPAVVIGGLITLSGVALVALIEHRTKLSRTPQA